MPGRARQGRIRRWRSYQPSNSAAFGLSGTLTFAFDRDTLRFMFMPRALANAVNQIARQTIGKDWSLYAALLDHWQEIVGMEYAKVTTPVKITFPHQPGASRRSGGTLTAKLPKGLAMEFTFKTEQIKQRINSY